MPEGLPVVVAVGGLDPSGGAGLAADVRACAGAGVFARPVLAAATAQNARRFVRVSATPRDEVADALAAALEEGFDAFKTGLLPDAGAVSLLARALPEAPLVVDPVLRATSGAALVAPGTREAYPRLLARATLATPNAAEARALTGVADAEEAAWALRKMGARNVLVTAGDEPGALVRDLLLTEEGDLVPFEATRLDVGPVRGTGCTLAALAAAHLAQGYRVQDAVRAALEETREAIARAPAQAGARLLPAPSSLLGDARHHPSEARARMAAVATTWRRMRPRLARRDVPEVGANLSYLPEDGDATRAAALEARCVRTGTGVRITGCVEIGGTHHTARIAAAAFHHDPSFRAAMNLRHRPEHVEAARRAGLAVASFRRADQPAQEPSTVEWGTRVAVQASGGVPDVLYDEGGPGKEPMMRVLGHDPPGVAAKLEAILGGP